MTEARDDKRCEVVTVPMIEAACEVILELTEQDIDGDTMRAALETAFALSHVAEKPQPLDPLLEDLSRAASAMDFGEEGLRKLCGRAALEIERLLDAYGEAHGRAAEMAESMRAESAPSTTACSEQDQRFKNAAENGDIPTMLRLWSARSARGQKAVIIGEETIAKLRAGQDVHLESLGVTLIRASDLKHGN